MYSQAVIVSHRTLTLKPMRPRFDIRTRALIVRAYKEVNHASLYFLIHEATCIVSFMGFSLCLTCESNSFRVKCGDK
ncbi:hypothetical protein BDR06DRAFT_625929 [Suillus hirtellus]|nr:hypothetical protein BDR06DRAFT_625929 [Suillus hirtellus]